MTSTIKIKIDRTGRGLPALWESGGGYTNTGNARIIAGPNGEPLRPSYIRRRGQLAGGDHALFIIRPGMTVIEAVHHRGDFVIRALRIISIEDEQACLELIATFDKGEWDTDVPSAFNDAVSAARRKARCYHCREPHWVRDE